MTRAVVLISGRGSNLGAILRSDIPGLVVEAVISNRADAGGLEIARLHGVEAVVVASAEHASRAAFDAALTAEVSRFAPDLVILAGFMRLLDADFVRQYEGRMLNIHPSLLPLFPGLHTHRRAIESGAKVHGATVHFVTPELDAGPIIAQVAVPVLDEDDEASLAARVLRQEHRLYPQAVRWFVEGRLAVENGRVRVLRSNNLDAALLVPPLETVREDES